jgi:hypothetical protein
MLDAWVIWFSFSSAITQNHHTVEWESTIASAIHRKFRPLIDMPMTALDLKHFINTILLINPKDALTTSIITPPEQAIVTHTWLGVGDLVKVQSKALALVGVMR